MKKWYNFTLTILTVAMLVLVTFNKLNQIGNWVDMSSYQVVVSAIWEYGPIVLLCMFAFGGLFGKIMSKIFGVIIVILLIVFTICMFAPEFVAGIFGASSARFLLNI